MAMITKISATTPKTILIAPELAFAIPVLVTNTGIDADTNGKKIIKAGTPIGGSTSVLENRQTVLTVTNSSVAGATSQGIALHDIDVTEGQANGTILISGYVDLNKLDVTVVAQAKTALTKIVFMKGA